MADSQHTHVEPDEEPPTDENDPFPAWDGNGCLAAFKWVRARDIKRHYAKQSSMLKRTDDQGRPLYRVTSGGNIVRTRPIKPHMKQRILKRDGFACVECGSTRLLEVAHIEPYRINGNNADSNMRTLCNPCHAEEERGRAVNG